MLEWEENRSPVEANIKSNSSMPVVAQTLEDDWGAKLVEEDPAGSAGGERVRINFIIHGPFPLFILV